MSERDLFIVEVQKASRIAVVTHMSPDGDALGSLLSTFLWLNHNFSQKSVCPMITGKKDGSWQEWEGVAEVVWVDDVAKELGNFDLVVFLDVGQAHRISNNPADLDLSGLRSVIIDHHDAEIMACDLLISYPDAASTTQILADRIFAEETLTKEVAKNLLLGLIFDTGRFKFIQQKNSDALITAKKLIDYLELGQLEEILAPFDNYDLVQFEVLRELTQNTLNDKKLKLTLSYMEDREDFKEKCKKARGAFINSTLRRIEGYPWGLVITRKRPFDKNEYALSFRSNFDTINVSALTERHFSGGGHPQAAGGIYRTEASTKDQVIGEILAILENADLVQDFLKEVF